MLESLVSETINIKSLSLEPPLRSDAPFDFERDITQADFEAEINLPEYTWETIKSRHSELPEKLKDPNFTPFFGFNSVPVVECLMDMTDVSLLMPEKRPEARETYKELERHAVNLFNNQSEQVYAAIFELSLLFPQTILPQVRSMDSANLREIVHVTPLTTIPPQTEKDNLQRFIREEAEVKLINSNATIDIDNNHWAVMKKILKEFRDTDHWRVFVDWASYMKVLSAEKAWITEDGDIEVVMGKSKMPFSTEIPRIPITRSF